jgi:MoaA/NifB/PqqE/SkfB family radical SAM enzyme
MMAIARQVNRIAAAKNIPLNAFIDLTWRCNLHCYYCYQTEYRDQSELSTLQWATILGQLAANGCLYITFSGGEPLIRADFIEILRSARKAGFAVSVITNGTLLTRRHSAAFHDLGIMDIGISLLAAAAPLHDKLSGAAGSFASALDALRMLQKAGIRAIIKHSVSTANFGEYRTLQKLADALGALLECDSSVLPAGNESVSPFALSQEQQREFCAEMYPKSSGQSDDEAALYNLHCDAGRSLCGITPGGDLLPCILIPVVFGNLAREPFATLWQGNAANRFRLREAEVDAECRACSRKQSCSRCYGVAARETSDWHGKAPGLCERAEAVDLNTGRVGPTGLL